MTLSCNSPFTLPTDVSLQQPLHTANNFYCNRLGFLWSCSSTYQLAMAPTSRYATAHASPRGAGDARPTAMDIIKDENLEGKLSDKLIIVTGGSSGIGIETVRALHATGATIYMPVRDVKKGEAVAESIRASSSSSGKIIVMEMKLDSLRSVKQFAEDFLGRSKQLNVLVNNAGVHRWSRVVHSARVASICCHPTGRLHHALHW